MSSRSESSDYSDWGWLVVLVVFLLYVGIYYTVKAVNLIWRVYGNHAQVKWLWWMLAPLVVSLSMLGISIALQWAVGSEVFGTLSALSFGAVLLTAHTVEVHYDRRFRLNKGSTLKQVLHPKGWWDDGK